MRDLAAPLAAELRARWSALEGEALEDWLDRALVLAFNAGRREAAGHECPTVAGLLEDFREAQRRGEAEADA